MLITALSGGPALAQATKGWVAKYTDPASDGSTGTLATAHPDGGVVVSGQVTHNAGPDLLTLRYDARGNELWARTYDGPQGLDDDPRGVVVDPSGNVIVWGASEGTATSASGRALVVCKYAPDGTVLWVQRYESSGSTGAVRDFVALDLDAAGQIYLTGTVRLGLPGATDDILVLAFDAGGQLLWTSTWDGPQHGDDAGSEVVVAPGGEIIVRGGTGGSGGPSVCALLAYASDGRLLWEALEPDVYAQRTAIGSDGTIFLAGTDYTLPMTGIQVVAFEPDGYRRWKASFPAPEPASLRAIRTGPAGDLYATYSFGIGYWAKSMATVRIGPTGQLLWERQVTGGFKVPYDIDVDPAGSVYVTGYSGAWLINAWRYMTHKYSPSGELMWSAWFAENQGGSETYSRGYALALGVQPGSFFVTGNSLYECTTVRFDAPPPPLVYCTSRPSSIAECMPSIGAGSSLASLTAGAGSSNLVCSPVPGGNRVAIALASTGGPLTQPVLGVYGWSCLATGAGWFRLPPVLAGGSLGACDGLYQFDVGGWLAGQAGNPALVPGGSLDLQAWYRDPPSPGGAGLSNALSLVLTP